MPDFQEFRIAFRGLGIVASPLPRFTIQARITDSQTGKQKADFTGPAKEIQFPEVLALLPAETMREIVERIAHDILYQRANLTP